ncbi:MAG: dihydrolipoyl dehydrogenase [Candidatus Marinimicrobia bacterium]|nr:dihydrolipoyl dehydrogenase [Candidatus Neomarinimicrobiota bacterium]|tara:strand:- start:22727 stop:24160 length:1434 start_codon:yes stop_codon:yes gene_type:complete
MEEKKHADVLVVGSGPGGYASAFRASDLGKNVIMVDREKKLGGVCLNRGCIPSKTLLHISKIIQEARLLSSIGVEFSKPKIDLDKIREHKNNIISKMNSGIAQMAKAREVQIIQGEAKFQSDNLIQISHNDKIINISFDNCVIAAGSSSASFPVPGTAENDPDILMSKTALELKSIPESLLIVGGGIIGLELGQVYSSLGSEVSVVEFLPQLISGADRDLVKPLERKLKKQFHKIMVSSKVVEIKRDGSKGLYAIIENDSGMLKNFYEKILIAVGRKPNTDILGLDNTSIKIDEKGFIITDAYMRTSVPNIFAIGDISGNPLLAHKATHEGKVAAEVICGLPAAFDARAIPSVVYTDPEIAWTGITEAEASAQGIGYVKGDFPWVASGRAQAVGDVQGKTKILFDKDTKKIIGLGMVGSGAGDMISEGTLAIEMGADAEDVGLTVHPHPTLSETVGLAAEIVEGTVTDLYLSKKEKL